MKLFAVLFLFMVLLGSMFSENKFEFHADHDLQDSHSTEVTYHSQDHAHQEQSKETKSNPDCQHYHIHCASLCLGLLETDIRHIAIPYSSVSEAGFSLASLLIKDFPRSLYRPPIV